MSQSPVYNSSIVKGDCTGLTGANGPTMRRHTRFVHAPIDGRNTVDQRIESPGLMRRDSAEDGIDDQITLFVNCCV